MKILHVIDSAGMWGAEKMLIALVQEQLASGCSPVVLSLGKPGEDRKPIELVMEQLGIASLSVRLSLVPTFRQLKQLKNQIEEIAPDVLHSHGYKGDILFGLILKPFLRIPVVATLHGWTSLPGTWSKLRLYHWLDARALSSLSAVVVVSKSMLSNPLFRGVDRKTIQRAVVIENGISTVPPLSSEPIREDIRQFVRGATVIGSIGRLSEEKGYVFLIEAFAELAKQKPALKLLLVGDGPLRSQLDSLVAQSKLEGRILITGYIENASRLLALFDVYVCSSLTEGLPLTLLEAMRGKVPIVSTAISSIPEVLQNGAGGGLVRSGSSSELAGTINKILTNAEQAKNMVEVSSDAFLNRYNSKIMAEKYRHTYQSIAS